MKYDQPGGNNGPGPGYSPSSQQPYPNEGNYGGSGHPETHSKPSKIGGKIETAVGTLIGSHDLRAKGIQKERFVTSLFCQAQLISLRVLSEARSLNMRSNELAQAESLEREAQMHRDRAMGGGKCLRLNLSLIRHASPLICASGGGNLTSDNSDRRLN